MSTPYLSELGEELLEALDRVVTLADNINNTNGIQWSHLQDALNHASRVLAKAKGEEKNLYYILSTAGETTSYVVEGPPGIIVRTDFLEDAQRTMHLLNEGYKDASSL